MNAQEIKDFSTRTHVEEMTVLLHQFAINYGLSADEVITTLLQKLKLDKN